jgi:two-component system sensor histidine kinase DesK
MAASVGLLWVREFGGEATPGHVVIGWGYAALIVLSLTWIWFWLTRAGRPDTALNGAAIAVITGCAAVAILAFPSGVVPLYFAAAVAGAAYPWQISSFLVAGETVLSAAFLFALHLRTVSDAQEVVVVAALGVGAITVRRLVGARAELEASYLEIQHLAAADARNRLARDLHDQLGQQLTVAVMQGELLSQDLTELERPELAARADGVVRATRESLELMRELVTQVRTGGFISEVDLARQVLATADIDLDLQAPGRGSLWPAADIAYGLVVREAVTNVLRHSRAKHVTILLDREDGWLALRITDDGRNSKSNRPPAFGTGLSSMQSRIEELGGRFTAHESESGFEIDARVPVSA